MIIKNNVSTLISAYFFVFFMQACSTYQLSPAPISEIKKDAHRIVNNREIVAVTSKGSSMKTLRKHAIKAGYSLLETEHLDRLGLIQLIFLIPDNLTGIAAIAELESFASDVTAGVNHAYELQNDTEKGYATKLIGWPESGCKALTRIGLIDDKVSKENFESQTIRIKSKSFTRNAARTKNHGNKVASVILNEANLFDVALYSAAVVADHENAISVASVDSILKALNWLKSEDVRLVNISLAGPYNKILDRGIQSAANEGMILVAAVGNSGKDSPPRYPAAFKQVIAVTAVDVDKNIYNKAVHGDHIDFAAPGVDVLLNDGKTSTYVTGTSYAAPFVTAIIASDSELAKSSNIKRIRSKLKSAVEDLGQYGSDNTYGAGLVRALNACH